MNETTYEVGGAVRSYEDEPSRGGRKRGAGRGGKLRWALRALGGLAVLGVVAALVLGVVAWRYAAGLDVPSHDKLADYEPAVTTRVHAGDGSLAAEFARERRLFVPVEAIPDVVKQAYISAEDKNFYEHSGVDLVGLTKAMAQNVPRYLRGERLAGASTITQQVAKNFLLSSDRKLERKAKEAMIARRMEGAFTKDEILELYLNEIYLGNRSYGVAAASLNYFGLPLDELDAAQAAYLATLGKGPANYHPVRHEARALARRNWILGQMGEEGYLTDAEVARLREEPLGARVAPPLGARSADSEYFAEAVRREVAGQFGTEALYDGGLSVRTTLDPRLQDAAQRAFRAGLEAYDRRHGWRGPLAEVELPADLSERDEDGTLAWTGVLAEASERLHAEREAADDLAPWRLGLVLGAEAGGAVIGLGDGTVGTLPLSDLQRCESCPEEGDHWARAYGGPDKRGPKVAAVTEVIQPGDVVYVEAVPQEGAAPGGDPVFSLRQVPAVNGALVAVDPHTGRVKAMVGGYSFGLSEFNRAIQAWRQPGSTFKPFVYAAALEQGYTPSSIVLDAPFVAVGANGGWYKPGNYVAGRYYGESTLRLGIEKSRNTMTARLAQDIGLGSIIDVAERFGVSDRLPRELSISLGSGETTPLRLTSAYAEFVNGGKKLQPVLIDRVQDRYGRTVLSSDQRACYGCDAEDWEGEAVPQLGEARAQVIDPRTAYQMVSIMEGVIDRGTGARVNRYVDPAVPLAGKTGTTDDYRDAWFVGFSPDLAVGIYVGFDTPATMGAGEGGGIVAAPIFGRFMADALAGETVAPFRAPSGIRMVRVDARSGRPASPGEPNVILEAFKAEDDLGGNRFDPNVGRGEVGRGDEGITDDLGGIY